MNQSKVVARIEEICKEFDSRVEVVGVTIARLELAKALAETEAAQQSIYLIALWCWFGASFLLNIVLLIVLAYIIG